MCVCQYVCLRLRLCVCIGCEKHVRNYILCNLFISFFSASAITCRFSHLLYALTHIFSSHGFHFGSFISHETTDYVRCVFLYFHRMMFVFLGHVWCGSVRDVSAKTHQYWNKHGKFANARPLLAHTHKLVARSYAASISYYFVSSRARALCEQWTTYLWVLGQVIFGRSTIFKELRAPAYGGG